VTPTAKDEERVARIEPLKDPNQVQ
jgi:hypothetical protein